MRETVDSNPIFQEPSGLAFPCSPCQKPVSDRNRSRRRNALRSLRIHKRPQSIFSRRLQTETRPCQPSQSRGSAQPRSFNFQAADHFVPLGVFLLKLHDAIGTAGLFHAEIHASCGKNPRAEGENHGPEFPRIPALHLTPAGAFFEISTSPPPASGRFAPWDSPGLPGPRGGGPSESKGAPKAAPRIDTPEESPDNDTNGPRP